MSKPSKESAASTSFEIAELPLVLVRARGENDETTGAYVAKFWQAIFKEPKINGQILWTCTHKHKSFTAARICGMRQFCRTYGSITKRDRQDVAGQRRFA